MTIKHRLNKLEAESPNKPPCFCNKKLLDLWRGADALTYCQNCKDKFDFWTNLAHDAVTSQNLTDIGEIQ
jgi:ribosomal protein L37AE/L43A